MKTINLIPKNLGKLKFDNIKEGEEYKIITNTILKVLAAFQEQSQGFNSSEIRLTIKIEDKLIDCESETVELEDAEYTFIKNCFSNVKWGGIPRVFASAEDAILNPVDPKVEAANAVRPVIRNDKTPEEKEVESSTPHMDALNESKKKIPKQAH